LNIIKFLDENTDRERDRERNIDKSENLLGNIDNLNFLISKIEKNNDFMYKENDQFYNYNNINNNFNPNPNPNSNSNSNYINKKQTQTNSLRNLTSINDKEIFLDNFRGSSGNLNLNINSEESPQKFYNYNDNKDIIGNSKYCFDSNSNVTGKNLNDYQNIGDVLSPVTAYEKDINIKNRRKDNFIKK
jgi:hypothetical protein